MISHILILAAIISCIAAFNMPPQFGRSVVRSPAKISMEYIPDGLTKTQWQAIKKKEDEEKKKDKGALGARRFKSRSFEAWQKAGGKHLFPVNPNEVPYEERPYMQRKGGDWEGSDLVAKGITGRGQGAASKRIGLDDLYEKAKAAGKLDSISIFGGKALPWTTKQANALDNSLKQDDPKRAPAAVAAKKRTPEEMAKLKANLFKPVDTAKSTGTKKKGLFGW